MFELRQPSVDVAVISLYACMLMMCASDDDVDDMHASDVCLC